MRNVVTPLKVGLLVVLGVVAFFVFYSLIRGRVSAGETSEYWAAFTDASGLKPKAEVRIAGVPVGAIETIELAGRKAKVIFSVPEDVPIYPNASISKRSSSILGDSVLELDPGSSEELARGGGRNFPHAGARTLPGEKTQPLAPGSEIPNVHEAMTPDRLLDTLGEVAGDIQAVTKAARDLLEDERGSIQEIVRNLAHASETLDRALDRSSRQLSEVLSNARTITADIRELTEAHKGDVAETLINARIISEQVRDVVASVQEFVGTGGEARREGAEGIRGSLANLEKTLSNLESITEKIDAGEGTLGKLVSDKELGERVSGAITTGTEYMDRLSSLQIELLLRSEYLFRAGAAKTYVGLKLVPAPDKYFLFEVVDDPLGYVSRETVIRTPPGQVEAANQEIRKTNDILKFTAEFGKRYSFLTGRFGLIESTGGVGLDLHFLQDHLIFRLDLFGFGNPETNLPRLRAYMNLRFLRHLYITAGVDDLANPAAYEAVTGRFRAGRDAFIGGGLMFTDEDLKLLFGATGSLLP